MLFLLFFSAFQPEIGAPDHRKIYARIVHNILVCPIPIDLTAWLWFDYTDVRSAYLS